MKAGKEQIIISLTTYSKRISNIPRVLDSIFSQTLPPDKVVINLAFEEIIPTAVADYIEKKGIEVVRVKDTKVFKKIIPTLIRYPEACIINIDDDWIYPPEMIEDFMNVHSKHPGFPISGNYICYNHINCHCGCASLTKKSYFGKWLDYIDDDVILNCPSDDIVYTYFAAKNGAYYIRTNNTYFINMSSVDEDNSYSSQFDNPEKQSWDYLCGRFGRVPCRKIHQLLYTMIKVRVRWLSHL